MTTNPTPEHKEQARAMIALWINKLDKVDSRLPPLLIDAVTAALSSRNTEIREVLEGLITCTLDEGDGPQLHWCPIGEDSDMECGPSCLAAARLYAKLQPSEKKLTGR